MTPKILELVDSLVGRDKLYHSRSDFFRRSIEYYLKEQIFHNEVINELLNIEEIDKKVKEIWLKNEEKYKPKYTPRMK